MIAPGETRRRPADLAATIVGCEDLLLGWPARSGAAKLSVSARNGLLH